MTLPHPGTAQQPRERLPGDRRPGPRVTGLFEHVLAIIERVHGTFAPTLNAHIHHLQVATALTDRGRALLPGDPTTASRDATAVVQAPGPHLAPAPAVSERAGAVVATARRVPGTAVRARARTPAPRQDRAAPR
ncbi:hypothetical protein [Kitasatospora griseola]|uniref:hypothetical protein n=1 Tax=Kitasatospora griseola TaxID=2064 RepID=UPI00342BCE9C